MNIQHDTWYGAVISYAATALAYTQDIASDIDWLGLGATVLLITRLIQDIPNAIKYIAGWFKGGDYDGNG